MRRSYLVLHANHDRSGFTQPNGAIEPGVRSLDCGQHSREARWARRSSVRISPDVSPFGDRLPSVYLPFVPAVLQKWLLRSATRLSKVGQTSINRLHLGMVSIHTRLLSYFPQKPNTPAVLLYPWLCPPLQSWSSDSGQLFHRPVWRVRPGHTGAVPGVQRVLRPTTMSLKFMAVWWHGVTDCRVPSWYFLSVLIV